MTAPIIAPLTDATMDDTDKQDAYRAARRAAGQAYMVTNPAGYAAIMDVLAQEYRGEEGQFTNLMQAVQLRCAKAANFPSFADWTPPPTDTP